MKMRPRKPSSCSVTAVGERTHLVSTTLRRQQSGEERLTVRQSSGVVEVEVRDKEDIDLAGLNDVEERQAGQPLERRVHAAVELWVTCELHLEGCTPARRRSRSP